METFTYGFELKELTDAGEFEGYAAVTGNVDRMGEVIDKGAFTDTLKDNGGRVPIFMNHDRRAWIGIGKDAIEDAKGLRVRGALTMESSDARNVYANLKHAAAVGHRVGLSIGFMVPNKGWYQDGDVRHIAKVDLGEYSIAPIPANPKARVTRVKSDGMSLSEIEDALREAGFSGSEAKRLISHVKASRDVAPEPLPRDAAGNGAISEATAAAIVLGVSQLIHSR